MLVTINYDIYLIKKNSIALNSVYIVLLAPRFIYLLILKITIVTKFYTKQRCR
jgi:hypothetical protein